MTGLLVARPSADARAARLGPRDRPGKAQGRGDAPPEGIRTCGAWSGGGRAPMRRLVVALALALWPGLGAAESIVLGLSQDQVAITATFEGSEILVFGAVRREAPIPPGEALEVVVTVSGPLTPVTVRRKERVLGIWANTDAVAVDAAPAFYAVATSGPLREVLSATEDLRHAITIPRAIRSVGAAVEDSERFTDALIRIRAAEGLYQVLENGVDFEQETLFRTSITLPANLVEGNYTTRIFLTREGQVIDTYQTRIGVQKVGLERWLFNLAHEAPAAYGVLALVLAVAAGWGASAAFAALRQ